TVPAAGLSQRPLTDGDRAAVQFIETLPPPEKQRLSNWMTLYRENKAPSGTAPAPRRLYGPADAKMKMVEWVDIRCGHCKNLNDTMNELKRAAPEGSFSLEARNFPLDSECNSHVQMSDGQGVRCTAAKAMICLEPTKDYWELRNSLFGAFSSLTKEKVLELASAGSMKRPELEACIASPDTAAKLKEDVDYAMKYNLQGTPLVVVNGREGFPGPTFLYTMALTGAEATSPAFNALPAAAFVADEHAGHNH
ncbi:MAG: thioredoxin domain-containing protein, partial [Myxococcaceae bacterium]